MSSCDFCGEVRGGDDNNVNLSELEVEYRAVDFSEGGEAAVRELAPEVMNVADYGKLGWTRRKVGISLSFSAGF